MNDTKLCAKKDVCGSCGWSDIPYEDQLKTKLDNINKSAQALHVDIKCEEIIPSKVTSHYRNKMDFIVDYRGNFGLREKGKWWKVIDDHTCFLPDEKIISLYKKTYEWVKTCGLPYYDRKSTQGYLRYIIFRTTTTGESMVIVLTSIPKNDEDSAKVTEALEKLRNLIDATTLVWATTESTSDVSFGENIKVIYGNGFINEEINGIKYIIQPNSFFQTNPHTAAFLQNKVLEFVESVNIPNDKNILDLYCGSGFFTLPLSKKFKNVFGVESVPHAIEDAEKNAQLNNLETKFLCAQAEKINIEDYTPSFILVDPPRAGLHPKVIKDLLQSKSEYLLYVSCKYERFFQEMDQLSLHFKCEKSVAVDMFPHTPHVELITLLKRI